MQVNKESRWIYKDGAIAKHPVAERDEYITPSFAVELALNPFKKWLANKKVLCPCDNAESEWVKYCQANNIAVKYWKEDFDNIPDEMVEWADIVITNPPFSLKQNWYKKFRHKKMIILGTFMFFSCILYDNELNRGHLRVIMTYNGKRKIAKWKNGKSGVPMVCIITNLSEAQLRDCKYWQYQKNHEVKEEEWKAHAEKIKRKTAEDMKAFKRFLYQKEAKRLKSAGTSMESDKYYGQRHNVYINPTVWRLYKQNSKNASINEILCWYLKKNK